MQFWHITISLIKDMAVFMSKADFYIRLRMKNSKRVRHFSSEDASDDRDLLQLSVSEEILPVWIVPWN